MDLRQTFAAMALGSVLFGAAGAAAAAPAGMAFAMKPMTINYDANAETYGAQTITITKASNAAETNFFIAFAPAASRRILVKGGRSISYDIYSAPAAPRDRLLDWTNAADTGDILYGAFAAPSRTAIRDCYIVLTPGGFVPAGTYTGSVTASYYAGVVAPLKSSNLQKKGNFHVRAIVGSIYSLSIVDSSVTVFNYNSPRHDFDFGTLTETAIVKTANVIARANAAYSLSVSSQNGNKLTHVQGDTASTIPYVFQVGATRYSLTPTPTVFAQSRPATTANGQVYAITVTVSVPPTAYPTWGDYKDILTFTITAG